jgi:glucosamine-6-phosphate deaminase
VGRQRRLRVSSSPCLDLFLGKTPPRFTPLRQAESKLCILALLRANLWSLPEEKMKNRAKDEALAVNVFDDKDALAMVAAEQAAASIRRAIRARQHARIIAATGAAQFEFLEALTKAVDIDWRCVEMFHLDEYIGLPMSHPASFRRFLQERLIQKVGITNYHFLDGDTDPSATIRRVGKALVAAPIDIAFVGIGENGHLAFNDPPADFETEEPYLIVNLDEACRLQQVGEGWFSSISETPKQAISMSIRQILKADEILAVVPDSRKAKAVQACLEGEIGPMAPASILRRHQNTTVYLDRNSAALLTQPAQNISLTPVSLRQCAD